MKNMKIMFSVFTVLLFATTIIGCSNNPTGGGIPAPTSTLKGGSQAAGGPSSTAGGGPAAVNLGSSGDYTILAAAGISTTGTTHITGNIGAASTASSITGFALSLHGPYATSSLVSGKVYAVDYAVPTPTNVGVAASDMMIAYVDAAGRTNPTATELGAGDISGKTLAPGLYKWGTGVLINGGVTLAGGSNGVWIFQISQTLTVGNGAIVHLTGGAQAKNVFWQVAKTTTLGTTSNFNGNILCGTNIAIKTGATLTGRALAQTAVTLQANQVTMP